MNAPTSWGPRALTLTRALTVALLVLGFAPLGVGPASAHAALVSSDPRDGATLDRLPGRISFTFGEDVVSPAYVVVRAADGSDVTSGEPVVDGVRVIQELAGPVTGEVTMAYRVVSVDGHPITGELAFTVSKPAKPAPAADDPAADDPGADDPADDPAADPADDPATDEEPAASDLAGTAAESEPYVVRHLSHFLLGGFLVVAAAVLLLLSRKRPDA